MKFQWILIACFAAELIKGISAAITRPLLKNFLRLLCVPVAFIVTFIAHALGVFQWLVSLILAETPLPELLAEVGVGGSMVFINAMLSAVLTPGLFSLTFFILLAAFRMVHVPLIYKYVMSRKEKKAINELRREIIKEKKQELALLEEAERKKKESGEPLTDIEQYYQDYSFSEDEIDILVRERIHAERKELKKAGFFKEGKKRFAMSFVCGAVGGFLVYSVTLMPFLHIMDFVSTATSVIDNSDATDSIVYGLLETTDKHVVKPFEESFVVELYDSMALVDLMNSTTRLGGKMVIDGEVYYTDDLTKDMITNSTVIAMELTTKTPNTDKIRVSMHNLISHPLLLNTFVDVIATSLKEIPDPEIKEGDMMNDMYVDIILHYKNADKDTIKSDIFVITDTLVLFAEKGIVMSLMNKEANKDSLLGDKDLVGDLVGSMSGLSVFNPLVGGVFEIGMDMILPNLGIPENNAGGYDYFTEQMINSFGTVGAMTPEDIAAVQEFMKGASQYESIYDYIASIGDKAKEFDRQVQQFREAVEVIQVEIERLEAELPSIADDPEKLEEHTKKIEELNAEAEILSAQADNLEVIAKELQEEIETKLEQIQPFITYYLAWMNVQKPFMLAGEDDSKACLSMVINGELYTCNTDEISIDDLLEVMNKKDEGSEEGEEGSEPDPAEESIIDKGVSESVDEMLAELPMKELLQKLKVTTDTSNIDGRVSPFEDLINYLIQMAGLSINDNPEMTFDMVWLKNVLEAYSVNDNISEASAILVAKLLAVDGSEESKNAFEYKGVTAEKIASSTHFGDEWTVENKKADGKIIGDLIFTFIDLKKTGIEAPGEGEDGLGAMAGTLEIFGEVMDGMKDTTCLHEIPPLMIEGLLKGKMLGSSIPSPILQEIYPDEQGSEDFSYAEYLNGLADRIDELMKLNKEGGAE